MIEVSENLRNLINEDSRTFRVKLVKGTDTYEEIRSFKKSTLLPNSSMSIGNALSACIECTATDVPTSITGAEMEAQITILGSEEWIKLGKFTAEKPTIQDGTVSFIAYDKMTAASNKPYTSMLSEGEHTVQEYFSDICTVLDAECVILPKETGSLSIVEDRLSGYNCRDALAYLAGFIGKNCIVNRDGRFEMIGFTAVDYDMLNADRITEPELSDTDCQIGYIACCVDNETTLMSGKGSNGFEYISPIMTQERLDSVGDDIFGDVSVVKVYKSGKVTQILGDPTLEIGDVVPLNIGEAVYNIPITSIVLEYDGGLQVQLESFELTEPSSLTLGERFNFQQKQAKDTTDAYLKAMVEFSEAIQQAYGVKSTKIDGIVYFHDTEQIENAQYIFCLTTKGLAIASGESCWGGSHNTTIWKYGVDDEGNAVLNMLKVFCIKANQIQAGALQSTNGKTSFDLDNAVFRTESGKSDYTQQNRTMELTSGEQTFKVVKEDENGTEEILAQGSFSANGLMFEDFNYIKPEEDYINAKIAEWNEKNAPRTWEEYSKGVITKYFARLKMTAWRQAYSREHGTAKLVLKSNIEGHEGKVEITPYGITYGDGSSVLTDKVTKLTSEDDCNGITEYGRYYYMTDSIPANAPFSNAAIIEVIPAGTFNTRVIQRSTRYGAPGYKKERILNQNEEWQGWTQIPLMFKKTYTSKTNSNGNAYTSIDDAYMILHISAKNADGYETYICHPYKSKEYDGSWYVNVTTVSDKTNIANTELTFTIYYAVL